MPPKPPEKGIQVISSFFKPKPTQTHTRAPPPDVVIIDSSDDDGPPPDRPVKRLKVQHDAQGTQLSPIASTSSAPPPSRRLAAFTYSSSSDQKKRELTKEEQQTRDTFIHKLVGKPQPNRRHSNYLESEHYMAPRGDSDDDNEAEEEDREEEEGEEEEEEDKDVKGKAKAKDQDERTTNSRFAKFAAATSSSSSAKTSSKGDKTSTSTVRYTPLEQQVLALKKANPGVLLAVEVGYKFKFFQEDAQTASRVLNIACFPQQHMLTASIPTHRIDIHTRRLLNAGNKVGIVKQIETAALKKVSENKSKPFTRALTRLYTSATFVDELGVDTLGASSESSTATLMGLVEEPVGTGKVRFGLVAVMPSTGQVVWDEFEDGLMRSELETRMLHLQPRELLLQKSLSPATESIVKHLAGQHNAGTPGFTCRIERIPKRPTCSTAVSEITRFYAEMKKRRKKEMKKVPSEIILGGDSDDDDDGGQAGGGESGPTASASSQKTEILQDGEPTAIFDLPKLVLVTVSCLITHLSAFNLSSIFLDSGSFASFSNRTSMTLNGNTITNLELLRNSTDYQESTGSLISVLDRCKTTMGKRLLRKWISKPLISIEAVNERLEAIEEIHTAGSNLALSKLRELLKTVPDLERGLSRIHFGRASPNELLRVLEALYKIGTVFDPLVVEEQQEDEDEEEKQTSFGLKSRLLKRTVNELPKIKRVVKGLVDQVNQKMARDGKKEDLFEREQDWPELVECKKARDEVERGIQDELNKARKVLRKPALQFKQVALEEYLLEVKVSEKNIVPPDWLRINGTKTYYRFRSPSLQNKIQLLEQARERLAAAANAAFLSFLQEVASHYHAFRSCVTSLSTLDCLFSLSLVALAHNYVKPSIVPRAGVLSIKNGRHAIIEQVSNEPFVPNSIEFGGRERQRRQCILTGLNMGGKSSLAKSVALIALMAQIGSFVPADECTTSLFDGIYTRMGASDSLMRNQSTFMLELSETSEILKLATSRSLIILNELGRGTSTNDGEAIAGAVLEWIAREKKSLTLFVTHYPNLASLAKKYPNSITLNHMSCLETPSEEEGGGGDVTFLFKLVEGLASSSHGLNVARMAGLPQGVLDVARDKRVEFEGMIAKRVEDKKRERLRQVLKRLERLGAETGEAVEVRDRQRGLIELCKSLVHNS